MTVCGRGHAAVVMVLQRGRGQGQSRPRPSPGNKVQRARKQQARGPRWGELLRSPLCPPRAFRKVFLVQRRVWSTQEASPCPAGSSAALS